MMKQRSQYTLLNALIVFLSANVYSGILASIYRSELPLNWSIILICLLILAYVLSLVNHFIVNLVALLSPVWVLLVTGVLLRNSYELVLVTQRDIVDEVGLSISLAAFMNCLLFTRMLCSKRYASVSILWIFQDKSKNGLSARNLLYKGGIGLIVVIVSYLYLFEQRDDYTILDAEDRQIVRYLFYGMEHQFEYSERFGAVASSPIEWQRRLGYVPVPTDAGFAYIYGDSSLVELKLIGNHVIYPQDVRVVFRLCVLNGSGTETPKWLIVAGMNNTKQRGYYAIDSEGLYYRIEFEFNNLKDVTNEEIWLAVCKRGSKLNINPRWWRNRASYYKS